MSPVFVALQSHRRVWKRCCYAGGRKFRHFAQTHAHTHTNTHIQNPTLQVGAPLPAKKIQAHTNRQKRAYTHYLTESKECASSRTEFSSKTCWSSDTMMRITMVVVVVVVYDGDGEDE